MAVVAATKSKSTVLVPPLAADLITDSDADILFFSCWSVSALAAFAVAARVASRSDLATISAAFRCCSNRAIRCSVAEFSCFALDFIASELLDADFTAKSLPKLYFLANCTASAIWAL